MKNWKSLICLLIALAMMLSLVGCSSSSSTSTSDDSEATEATEATDSSDEAEATVAATSVETVYIGEYNAAGFVQTTFDPTGLSGAICNNSCNYLIYDMLFYVNSSGEYDSRVVETYEWVDETHLEITIKDGIYFSNGDQLTGEDILYSLQKRQESSMRSTYYQIYLIDECSVSDDGMTVTLVTESENSIYMSGLDFAILDKSYVEGIGFENIDWADPDQVVGSGPYSISYYVADSEIRFEKRDDYWGTAYGYEVVVEEYICYTYADRSTMSIDFETGVIDLAIDLAETDYSRLLDDCDGSYTCDTINGNVIVFVCFDVVNNEYLADATIREALCHAVDIEAITLAANGSYGGVATSMFAENELGYLSGCTYDYDPDYAKELLESAGISDGEIQLTFLCMENVSTMATVLQSYWAAIGVDLDVQVVDAANYWGNIGVAGSSDIMYYGTTTNPSGDPATHLSYFKSTSNFCIIRRDYDDLLIAAETTLDEETRIDLYQQLQLRWYENFDCIPMYEYTQSFVYNTSVISSLSIVNYAGVWLFDAEYVG